MRDDLARVPHQDRPGACTRSASGGPPRRGRTPAGAPRSTRRSPTSKTGSSLVRPGARRVPQRHPHAREQLAHAERLRHVVVGPGVEGGDLVPLLPARREDQIGMVEVHCRMRRGHGQAVHVGKTEIEDDQIRLLRRGQAQIPSSPVARLDQPVALLDRVARRKRRICGSSSIRSTIDPGWRLSRFHPPPAPRSEDCPRSRAGRTGTRHPRRPGFPAQILPPCASTMPRQMGRPRPTPRRSRACGPR